MIVSNSAIRSIRLCRLAVICAGLICAHARPVEAEAGDPPSKSVAEARDVAAESARDARSPLRFEMPSVPDDVRQAVLHATTGPQTMIDETRRIDTALPNMLLMAGLTFLPAALLMTTSFVRIQIALGLLRQALGSPTIPGNQVIVALSLLLSVLVMKPVGEKVYEQAIMPYSEGRISQAEALEIGSRPIKQFMIDQIRHTGHEAYLEEIADYAAGSANRNEAMSVTDSTASATDSQASAYARLPLHVVAPAFLISELTTALSIGFAIYLPFLVVDLVVATLLAAMGIWMMPPTLVSTPTKLILFVLADGWMLTAGALINGFSTG